LNLAETIQYQLSRQKLTLYRLAQVTGISYGYLDRIEKGLKKNPSYEILKKIAVAFGLDVKELLAAAGYEPEANDKNRPPGIEIPLIAISEFLVEGAPKVPYPKESTLIMSNVPQGTIGLVVDQPLPEFNQGDILLIDRNGLAKHDATLVIRDTNHIAVGRILKTRVGTIWTPFGSHQATDVTKQWVAQHRLGTVVGMFRRY